MVGKEFYKNRNIVEIVTDFLHVINYCNVSINIGSDYNFILVGAVKNDPRGAYYCTNPLFERQKDQVQELYFPTTKELLEFLEHYKDTPVSNLEICGLQGYP